jgi:hypothetical protein
MEREMSAVPMMSPEINVTPDPVDPIVLNAPTTLRMPAAIKKCGKKHMIFQRTVFIRMIGDFDVGRFLLGSKMAEFLDLTIKF